WEKVTVKRAKRSATNFLPSHPQAATHRLQRRRNTVTPLLMGPSIPKASPESAEIHARFMLALFHPWRSPADLTPRQAGSSYKSRFDTLFPCFSSEHRAIIGHMQEHTQCLDAKDDWSRQRRKRRGDLAMSGEGFDGYDDMDIDEGEGLSDEALEAVDCMLQESDPHDVENNAARGAPWVKEGKHESSIRSHEERGDSVSATLKAVCCSLGVRRQKVSEVVEHGIGRSPNRVEFRSKVFCFKNLMQSIRGVELESPEDEDATAAEALSTAPGMKFGRRPCGPYHRLVLHGSLIICRWFYQLAVKGMISRRKSDELRTSFEKPSADVAMAAIDKGYRKKSFDGNKKRGQNPPRKQRSSNHEKSLLPQ
ncbi:hypothetical protein B9479_008265, partial [Cryptococcus floricola]